jgi:hypothetical protein
MFCALNGLVSLHETIGAKCLLAPLGLCIVSEYLHFPFFSVLLGYISVLYLCPSLFWTLICVLTYRCFVACVLQGLVILLNVYHSIFLSVYTQVSFDYSFTVIPCFIFKLLISSCLLSRKYNNVLCTFSFQSLIRNLSTHPELNSSSDCAGYN